MLIGELWEQLGPLARIVTSNRTAISKLDDRMFFDRLTKDLLPEEVYHSWVSVKMTLLNRFLTLFFAL